LDLLKRFRHLFVEDMSVSGSRLDVGVIDCPLHKLKIAGIAKQLRPHIMAISWNRKFSTPACPPAGTEGSASPCHDRR
jgi:hypothetical protein